MSKSYLGNVIIERAGQLPDDRLTSALSVLGGVPPIMNQMIIRQSAYNGLNVTDPTNGFKITSSRFVENRGYGVFINSSVGRILLSNVEVQENGADGIRFVHFDKPIITTQDSFCQTPNLGMSQVFPIRYTHKQNAREAPNDECCQEFYAKDMEGQVITIHFPVMMSRIEDHDPMQDVISPHYAHQVGREGSIYVIDGHSGRIIADFYVRNDTRVQSVSSIMRHGPLKVCYRPAHYRNVLFTVEAVVDYAREYDVAITDSRVVANNGRGVWSQNLRSGILLDKTSISHHDHVAGLHVSGVADVIVNNSIITDNLVDGINITTGGGFIHVNLTELRNNTERGLAIWFNESIHLQSFNYSTHITRSFFDNNRIGLVMSEGCHFPNPLGHVAFWNVSMNMFEDNREQAIYYHTCIPRPRILKMQMTPTVTRINVTHNRFKANGFHALHMAPVFFADVDIAHNEFRLHERAVLYIDSRNTFNVEKFVEDAENFPFSFYTKSSLTNQRNLALDDWPVHVKIRHNSFRNNQGYYVASIGLLEPESSREMRYVQLKQRILFTRNVLRDNYVFEPFPSLNVRSKAAAVLCLTSSNVLVRRNEFVNPKSKYELGIHLSSHYRTINASLNYWGAYGAEDFVKELFDDKHLNSAATIYERIFDRKNRYNLAQVEFLPYIMVENALESERGALSQINDREKISKFFKPTAAKEIGGQVRGQVNLDPGVYYVKRDIYVSPEGELVLHPNTELRFDQSVGIFVQGKFKAQGRSNGDIKFVLATSNIRRARDTSKKSSSPVIIANTTASKPTSAKLVQAPKISSFSQASIRLSNVTEGRLEVRISNEWGTVCGHNFDIEDAAIVCHQLGLVLNERDWKLEKSEFWSAGNARTIVMSNVDCTHLDVDITKCRAEKVSENDFESGWCPVGEVGIRCYPPAWAGIRFGMLTEEAMLEYVTIERAGLFDYQTRVFSPALQFDFNRFNIKNSIIRSNIDSGIGLLWNDVLFEHDNNDIIHISDTKVLKNLNYGIVTRTQGLTLSDSLLSENKVSGFHYEPTFTRDEQEELTFWVVKEDIRSRKVNIVTIPSPSPFMNYGSHYNHTISLGRINQQVYVYIPRRPAVSPYPYKVLINTGVGQRIGVLAVSPIFQTRSTESLRLYSPSLESTFIPKMLWDLQTNLTTFPFVYPGYQLVLDYSTGDMPYGGILLMFTSKKYPQTNYDGLYEFEQNEMNTIRMINNEFIENGKGLSASHCSMNVDYNGNYCKRYGNETICLERNLITRSKGAGLFVNSYAHSSSIPYSLLLSSLEMNDRKESFDTAKLVTQSIVGEINYTLIENRFTNNGDFGSIVLYDKSLYQNGDMQRSNLQLMPGHVMTSAIGTNYPSNTNLFHWNIKRCLIEANKNGGVDIRLPYTWLYNENFTHTVVVEDSNFIKNHNFEFSVGGHYGKVNITSNRFIDNHCKLGLFSIGGMEKLIKIEENEMVDNHVQRYVLEMNIASHADKFGTVQARITRNTIRNNRYSGPALREYGESSGYAPETYAISIKGVQQVNVTRNVLTNRNLQFELLAGVKAGSLKNDLDARENWWGVNGDPKSIRERIFDFDDWNNFATTIFSPWLSSERIDASLVYEMAPTESPFAERYLGGRITKSMVLVPREQPYVVNTDMTIMPGVTLTIRPGVVIEFFPSVGILVLGDLSALGLERNPITFRPVAYDGVTVRNKNGGEDILIKLNRGGSFKKRGAPTTSQPHTEQLVFSKSDIGGVRLCLTELCNERSEKEADLEMKKKVSPNGDSAYPVPKNGRKRHGFLEIYNTTTLQWAPVCDPRFTERNAQVVCRQLGFSTLNVFVHRGPRPDMDFTLSSRINFWPEALECDGNEAGLSDCDHRTFSKDTSNKQSSDYDNTPFFTTKEADQNFVFKTNYYHYITDNQTREMIFYSNDDWSVLEDNAIIQSTSCRHDGNDFVYVFCGEDNIIVDHQHQDHWGGVRFALPAFEEVDTYGASRPNKVNVPTSSMHYVNIIGAGILHGEKNAAVQMIQRSVPLEFVKVERSASHGIEVIAPPGSLRFHQLKVQHNLGLGVNMLMLGASSSESLRVPYQPLGDGSAFSVPYNAFSLVDMCDAQKELKVGEKMIVYYKYDNRPVDCVKIFTSANPLKRIGLRFLQLNLWSSVVEPEGKANLRSEDYLQGKKFYQQSEDIFHNRFVPIEEESMNSYIDESYLNSLSDSVLIWDGDIFNETTRRLLGEVYSDSSQNYHQYNKFLTAKESIDYTRSQRRSKRFASPTTARPSYNRKTSSKTRLYKSSRFSLSIQLHASGASGRYGFIAEITTLPSAYYADRNERNLQHNITYSQISNNTGGALLYRSVGETIPPLSLHHDIIDHNCRREWGNFSTCESATMQLEVQNMQNLYFQNNRIESNRAGGVHVRATSYTAVSALNAHLANNLFSDNIHKEALYFEGANAGQSYQTINADKNYFSRNRSPHRSNIVFGRAVVKFHDNIVINNYADSQMFVAGFAHAQSSSNLQKCARNFFYNNHALNERGEQSTIIANSIGQIYTDNYLVNPDNNFELSTRNRTIITTSPYSKQSNLEPTAIASILASAIVNAPNNWWGFNETSAIAARIRDSRDNYNLIPVQFQPFYTGNWSVLSGQCYGGYEKIGDTCFVYVGGRMAYHEARRFCEKDNSSMPFVRAANQAELTRYVYIQQPEFNRRRHPVWVQSFDVPIGACSILVGGIIRVHDCNDNLPFICERDPEIGISTATLAYWYQEPLGIASIAISVVTAVLCLSCIFCWICKSRHRHLEKLERRNSIRASIRSSRSFASSMNTLTSEANYLTNRKLLHDSAPNIAANYITHNKPIGYHPDGQRISANPTGSVRGKLNGFNGSVQSSQSSLFINPNLHQERLVMAPKRFPPTKPKANMFEINEQDDNQLMSGPSQHSSNLMLRAPMDIMYENQAFKGQSTPLSPASVSSRDDTQGPMRLWTPTSASTLDFKMGRPAEIRDFSQYTTSTDNLNKSFPSSSSASSSSQSPSPSSIVSRLSQLPPDNVPLEPSTTRTPIEAPVYPPPLPPMRQSIKGSMAEQRRSLNPAFLRSQSQYQAHSPVEEDREMLTFGPKKYADREPMVTDLDEEFLGGSQPTLMQAKPPSTRMKAHDEPPVHYLETSLDADTFLAHAPPPDAKLSTTSQAQAAKARLYASQPLETAM